MSKKQFRTFLAVCITIALVVGVFALGTRRTYRYGTAEIFWRTADPPQVWCWQTRDTYQWFGLVKAESENSRLLWTRTLDEPDREC